MYQLLFRVLVRTGKMGSLLLLSRKYLIEHFRNYSTEHPANQIIKVLVTYLL